MSSLYLSIQTAMIFAVVPNKKHSYQRSLNSCGRSPKDNSSFLYFLI